MHGWLYAGGHGVRCSMQQVIMLLVAALMPEEVKDDETAEQLRFCQASMLQRLSEAFPEAMLYSVYFRWGLLLEVSVSPSAC